jgi:hypothetical protein
VLGRTTISVLSYRTQKAVRIAFSTLGPSMEDGGGGFQVLQTSTAVMMPRVANLLRQGRGEL